jgi:RNAse (barnase) inhibitor barstar
VTRPGAEELAPILGGAVPPGRYRVAVPIRLGELLARIDEAGWTGRVVDGSAMDDRAGLFAQFAAALEFPDWFGHNWDALVDCLRDLSWLPGVGIAVLWRQCANFQAAAPGDWRTAAEAIDDAIEDRVAAGRPPLFVLLPARRGATR